LYFYLMPSNNYSVKVAFSVTNCICNDQRVLKIAAVVQKLDCEVTIIGRKSGNCCNSDSVPFKTKRFRMLFKRSFFFYSFFNIRLFIFLLFHKYDLLVSDDLDTLLPNYLISKLKKIPLVYDSHEYFTGVPEIQNRHFVKFVWKSIEKSIFPHLKFIMTVSDSIASQYEKEYGLRPLVVRNCSGNSEEIKPFIRRELDINEDHLLLILQGTGINVDRGGSELIDAVNLTDSVSLIVVGDGDQFMFLKEKVLKLGLTERIKFFTKCNWQTLMRYTRSADAGMSLDKNSNLNYKFSLPNKLFEYISAGITVIATDLPEISKIINEYNCGVLIPEPVPEAISDAIISLRDNRGLLSQLKYNSVVASKSLNWENESKKIKNIYGQIISIILKQ
jgi:glycosyltransferase involved in cell wall biosynthesis